MYIWTIPATKQKIMFFRYEQQKMERCDRDIARTYRLYSRPINNY